MRRAIGTIGTKVHSDLGLLPLQGVTNDEAVLMTQDPAETGNPTDLSQVASLSAQIVQLESSLGEAQTQLDRFRKPPRTFFESGLFYIILGLGLLIAAYIGLAVGVHTSFSFILVVLGFAVLLFGTGTQGIGKLESGDAAAKYSVALAGGAGALALATGFGMIKFGPEMQRAFDTEIRYVEAILRANADGQSSFDGYWPDLSVNGQPIPSVHRGDLVLALVPYYDTQPDVPIRVSYILRSRSCDVANSPLRPRVSGEFKLLPKDVEKANSGTNYPTYDKVPLVDMRSEEALEESRQAALSRQLRSDGKTDLSAIPPASAVAQ